MAKLVGYTQVVNETRTETSGKIKMVIGSLGLKGMKPDHSCMKLGYILVAVGIAQCKHKYGNDYGSGVIGYHDNQCY